MSLSCYKIVLKVVGQVDAEGCASAKPCEWRDEYVDVENGIIYMIAENTEEAGRSFPTALQIERVGPGYEVER